MYGVAFSVLRFSNGGGRMVKICLLSDLGVCFERAWPYERALELERGVEEADTLSVGVSELSLSILDNHVEVNKDPTQWAITTGPAWY